MDHGLPPDNQERAPIPWIKVGYGLTALWMLVVLWITGNDVAHPLYNYIFGVPLAAWAGVVAVNHILKTWRRR